MSATNPLAIPPRVSGGVRHESAIPAPSPVGAGRRGPRPALAGGRPLRGKDRYLVFGAPQILEEDIREVVDTLRSGWIGTGPKTVRLERSLAGYLDVPHGVATASCTVALRLALETCGIGPGSEVITTPMTFCATVNAILHAGAIPVLADCDPATGNLRPDRVREKLSSRTRAILPVHYAGRLCDMEALTALAAEHGLTVIEDCAHAIEATDAAGRHAGTFGRAAAFSFYATKNVTCAEGGMLVTHDPELAERVRRLTLHGLSTDAWKRHTAAGYRHYEVEELGYKANLTDLQAALALNQLARVELNHARREAIWRRYDAAFADLPLERPAPAEPGTRHARHLYTVLLDEAAAGLSRDTFLEALHAEGIGAGVHYRSLAGHRFYQERLGVRPEDFPAARAIGARTVSLPLSAALTDADVQDVIGAVRRILTWVRW